MKVWTDLIKQSKVNPEGHTFELSCLLIIIIKLRLRLKHFFTQGHVGLDFVFPS